MTCEQAREQLPDYTLGTLSEIEAAAVRRHLRGCAACRGEANSLDEGVAMFASAAHELTPPPELKDRVLTVMAEEWQETPVSRRDRFRTLVRWPSLAAAALILVGALAWGGVAQVNANRFHGDAATYQQFLHSLGGRDVRVGVLHADGNVAIDGTAVVYDSDISQSWTLILVRAPGYRGKIYVTLSGAGKRIPLQPVWIDANGEGSTWMVTASDLSKFTTVRLTSPTGQLLADATVANHHT